MLHMTPPWEAPSLRYLSSREVEGLLPPLPRRLELVRETFAEIAAGTAIAPPATCLHPRPTGFADAMPAYSASRDLTSVKWVCGDERNTALGAPYISGLMILNDSETGIPRTILDGGAITAARTAAVSGVAVAALARSGWSRVALIGYGVQARAHVRVLRTLNPEATIRVSSRRGRPAGEDRELAFVGSPREAVDGADVVITGIPLSAKLDPLLEPAWLAPDALVLPLDDDASLSPAVAEEASFFVVDDRDRYERDRGKGLFDGWRDADASVPEVLADGGPTSGLRLCMNQGIGLMDGPFAAEVSQLAEAEGVGRLLAR